MKEMIFISFFMWIKLRTHLLPLLLLITFLGSIMFWAFSNAWYLENESLKTFSWIVNSDWMMHISQVQNFSTLPFWHVATHHPLYSGDILSYPFFVNFLSGIILWATNDLVFSMVFPMMVGTLLFLFGVYFLLFSLGNNRMIAVIAFFLFFFSGGWQWIYVFSTWSWENWKILPDYVFDYDHMVKVGYHWKSVFLTTLLPQRSFLWGMAIGSIVIALFIHFFIPLLTIHHPKKYWFHHVGSRSYERFFFIGLILGTVSFIHTHSFLWIVLFFMLLSIFYFRFLFIFVSLALGSFFTAVPFILLLFQKQNTISEISLFPLNHLASQPQDYFITSFFSFWFFNWGLIFCMLCVIAFPLVFRWIFSDTEIFIRRFLLSVFIISTILWIVFSMLQMQGNPWDNTKLWLWSSLFFSFLIAAFLYRLWKCDMWGKVVSILLFFSSIISGVIMLHSGLNDEPLEIFSKKDRETASLASSIVPPASVVLSDDYFHLPFTALVPKQSFMGYRGWISSYGMKTDEKVEVMEKIFSGSSEALSLIQKHNIDFILIDESAKANFKVREDFFENTFPEVFLLNHWGKLYKTH